MGENFIRSHYNQSEEVYSEDEQSKAQRLPSMLWLRSEHARKQGVQGQHTHAVGV